MTGAGAVVAWASDSLAIVAAARRTAPGGTSATRSSRNANRRCTDRAAALEKLSREFFDIPADTLGQVPYLLVGTLDEIAEQVRAHRERYGITYFTVLDNAMTDFAAVFDRLR